MDHSRIVRVKAQYKGWCSPLLHPTLLFGAVLMLALRAYSMVQVVNRIIANRDMHTDPYR